MQSHGSERARVHGAVAEFFLDAEELVVFADAVGPAKTAGLDLADAARHHKVGNRAVFGLAAAMTDHRPVAVPSRQRDAIKRLRQRADLVELQGQLPAFVRLLIAQLLNVGM